LSEPSGRREEPSGEDTNGCGRCHSGPTTCRVASTIKRAGTYADVQSGLRQTGEGRIYVVFSPVTSIAQVSYVCRKACGQANPQHPITVPFALLFLSWLDGVRDRHALRHQRQNEQKRDGGTGLDLQLPRDRLCRSIQVSRDRRVPRVQANGARSCTLVRCAAASSLADLHGAHIPPAKNYTFTGAVVRHEAGHLAGTSKHRTPKLYKFIHSTELVEGSIALIMLFCVLSNSRIDQLVTGAK
jgi:hypothetical protein